MNLDTVDLMDAADSRTAGEDSNSRILISAVPNRPGEVIGLMTVQDLKGPGYPVHFYIGQVNAEALRDALNNMLGD